MPVAPAHTNRLINELSPYLLQHAHNPVDWHPWGAEAIDRARGENKPIFLSVGYSSCYWCHVMERECFENEAIARLMNERFINIKVDREERPDVDQLYMLAVQIITRQGGWPMSVFLTPQLKPFFGGTYFPPRDLHGRPGFARVLASASEAFAKRRQEVEDSADEILRIIARFSHPREHESPIRVDEPWVAALVERSASRHEPTYGGFSPAPKFPQQTLLELLLEWAEDGEAADRQSVLGPLLHTLDAMMYGGIRDQLGGGFHRYSTDAQWLVPHFEIMLYDNAMLAACYARAWRLTRKPAYAEVTRGILDFVLREMTSPQGAFYTAFDAETDAMEGATYLWTRDEAIETLRQAAVDHAEIERFCRVYGLDDGPNFADPHHGNGQPDRNVLFVAEAAEGAAITDPGLARVRGILLDARRRRPQPMLDTKVLTSWNALMIRAMALAGRTLEEPRYVYAAAAAARYLLDHHRVADGTLIRSSRAVSGGDAKQPSAAIQEAPSASGHIPGFLDDYAFLVQALMELFEATGQKTWRDHAVRVAQTMKAMFLDAEPGGFFFTPVDAGELPIRQKLAHESPLPSGNAAAAMGLLKLGEIEEARRVLALFAQTIQDEAEGMPSMVHAAVEYLKAYPPFTIGAENQDVDRLPTPQEIARGVVALSARWESPTELLVDAEITSPFHLNAEQSAEAPGSTILSLSLPAGMEARVEYPPGTERNFAFAGRPLRVYEDRITIRASLSQALSGGTLIRATLAFQPCTEEACLPPASTSIDLAAE